MSGMSWSWSDSPPQDDCVIFGKICPVLPESFSRIDGPNSCQSHSQKDILSHLTNSLLNALLKITLRVCQEMNMMIQMHLSRREKSRTTSSPSECWTPNNAARDHISYLAGTKHHCLILSIKTLRAFFQKLLRRLSSPSCSHLLVYLDPVTELNIYFIYSKRPKILSGQPCIFLGTPCVDWEF